MALMTRISLTFGGQGKLLLPAMATGSSERKQRSGSRSQSPVPGLVVVLASLPSGLLVHIALVSSVYFTFGFQMILES